LPAGQPGSLDPRADLGECHVARSGRIVGERREAAIFGGAQLGEGQVAGRHQHPIAHLFGSLHHRIDRIDDASEYALIGAHVAVNQVEHTRRIPLAGQLQLKASRMQPEQRRQQSRIIHAGAMRGVAVAAGTCVNADPGALFHGEMIEHPVVERYEVIQQASGRRA